MLIINERVIEYTSVCVCTSKPLSDATFSIMPFITHNSSQFLFLSSVSSYLLYILCHVIYLSKSFSTFPYFLYSSVGSQWAGSMSVIKLNPNGQVFSKCVWRSHLKPWSWPMLLNETCWNLGFNLVKSDCLASLWLCQICQSWNIIYDLWKYE